MKRWVLKTRLFFRYMVGSSMLYLVLISIIIYTFMLCANSQPKLIYTVKSDQETSVFSSHDDPVVDRQEQQLLSQRVAVLNAEQRMQIPADMAVTGQHLSPEDVVILIQVHDRLEYLRQLIHSLRHTRNIGRALLIFSHDVFSEAINAVVRQVDFARYLQIFYPYSLQIYSDRFPGPSPKDCARDTSRLQALLTKCNNAHFPDKYGHFREAKFTATKHHWWWKVNRVFNELKCTRNHSGPFVLIEEDHFVSPDFLHALRHLRSARDHYCPHCGLLSMGTYRKPNSYRDSAATAIVSDWVSSSHNMGMVIDRDLWRVLLGCAHLFCTLDDYNWDWSLQHLLRSDCVKTHPIQVLSVQAPRIFHIGECGVHHRGSGCDHLALLRQVKATLEAAAPYLFSSGFRQIITQKRRTLKMKPNGGWADPRDHQLCLSFSSKTL